MNKFLVRQIIVSDNSSETQTKLSNIIAIVSANTKEEAVGKFVIKLQEIKGDGERIMLGIECDLLDLITQIN